MLCENYNLAFAQESSVAEGHIVNMADQIDEHEVALRGEQAAQVAAEENEALRKFIFSVVEGADLRN